MNGCFKIFEDTAIKIRDDVRDCSTMGASHSYRILVSALHIVSNVINSFLSGLRSPQFIRDVVNNHKIYFDPIIGLST